MLSSHLFDLCENSIQVIGNCPLLHHIAQLASGHLGAKGQPRDGWRVPLNPRCNENAVMIAEKTHGTKPIPLNALISSGNQTLFREYYSWLSLNKTFKTYSFRSWAFGGVLGMRLPAETLHPDSTCGKIAWSNRSAKIFAWLRSGMSDNLNSKIQSHLKIPSTLNETSRDE